MQSRVFLKRGKKQQCQGKKTSPPRRTWPWEHLGSGGAPVQDPPSSTASTTSGRASATSGCGRAASGCGRTSERHHLEHSSRLCHSRWIHSASKPSTRPAAPLAAFFVCSMIPDRPFSLGSACIASPRLLFVIVVTSRSAHGTEQGEPPRAGL